MEMKNKLTMTRGDGDNKGKRGKLQDTCIKDPWTNTMGGREDCMWEVGVHREGKSNGRKMVTTVTEQQFF